MRTFHPIHVFKIWLTDCITSAIRKDKGFFLYSSKEKQLFLQDPQEARTQQKKIMDHNYHRRHTMTPMSRVWLTPPCSGLREYWGHPGNPSQGTRGTSQNTFLHQGKARQARLPEDSRGAQGKPPSHTSCNARFLSGIWRIPHFPCKCQAWANAESYSLLADTK